MKRAKWFWILVAGLVVLIFVALIVVRPKQSVSEPSAASKQSAIDVPTNTDFTNPEPVTIRGYDGPQEDPSTSPDGTYLFFDSHTDGVTPIYIYVAKRIDYKTFSFVGRLPGLNMEALEAFLDSNGNFYFLSPLLIAQQGAATTIGHALFSDGSVSEVSPIRGVQPKAVKSGDQSMTYDIAITPDGNTLYFSDFDLSPQSFMQTQLKPIGSQLAMATKNADGSFTRAANSDEILKNVNGIGLLVYNASPSADGLELAFDAAPYFGPHPHIYVATRSSTSEPFGQPQLVAAANIPSSEFSEPGSISSDGKHLYFHVVFGPSTSKLYVLTQN